MMANFDTEAGKLFTQLFTRFETATKNLNRHMDENVFQKTAAQYVDLFKHELTQLSLRLIENKPDHSQDNLPLRQHLTKKLMDYTNEFSRKIKQL